jgi:hypothetical protein
MSTYGREDPWLLPFLSVVRIRPGMFLGSESVRILDAYMTGYVQAREDLGAPPYGENEGELLSEFDSWLAEKIKIGTISAGPGCAWPWYIEQIDTSSKNVHTFFKLFGEFLASRGMGYLDPDEAVTKCAAHWWRISRPSRGRTSG